MEPDETPHSPKWPPRLALLFLLLYAVFWSLGPFFSRSLLALAAYFSFLTLYGSTSVQDWLKNLFSSARPPAAPRFAPRQAYRLPPIPGAEPPAYEIVKKAARIVRLVIFAIGSVVFIVYLIAVFLPDDDEAPVEEETVSSSTEEADKPDNKADYFTEKGNNAMNSGLTDSAHYYYDEALRIDPQNVFALYDKGLTYIMSSDYYHGNAITRRCLLYHSDYDQAWWLLGFSYDKMNNSDSALYCLEVAKSHDYSDPNYLQLLGEVYEKKGLLGDALKAYQKVITIDTTKADVYRKLATLDPGHASDYLRRAAALEK